MYHYDASTTATESKALRSATSRRSKSSQKSKNARLASSSFGGSLAAFGVACFLATCFLRASNIDLLSFSAPSPATQPPLPVPLPPSSPSPTPLLSPSPAPPEVKHVFLLERRSCRGDASVWWTRSVECRNASAQCGKGDTALAFTFSMVPRCGSHGNELRTFNRTMKMACLQRLSQGKQQPPGGKKQLPPWAQQQSSKATADAEHAQTPLRVTWHATSMKRPPSLQELARAYRILLVGTSNAVFVWHAMAVDESATWPTIDYAAIRARRPACSALRPDLAHHAFWPHAVDYVSWLVASPRTAVADSVAAAGRQSRRM